MDYNNRDRVRKLRTVLLVVGIVWLLVMTVFVFFEQFLTLAISAGLLLFAALLVALLNFQYVRITIDKDKVIVRYYSIFSVERLFQMFEFPADQLRNIEVHNYFWGLKCDIRYSIRVRKGLADYPWVSLSAIPFHERSKLIIELQNMVPNKQSQLTEFKH